MQDFSLLFVTVFVFAVSVKGFYCQAALYACGAILDVVYFPLLFLHETIYPNAGYLLCVAPALDQVQYFLMNFPKKINRKQIILFE